MPGGNTVTSQRCIERSLEEMFVFYDRLPQPLREMLQLAPCDVDPVEVDAYVGRVALVDLMRACMGSMSRFCRDAAGDWGPGYPAMRQYRPVVVRRLRARRYRRGG